MVTPKELEALELGTSHYAELHGTSGSCSAIFRRTTGYAYHLQASTRPFPRARAAHGLRTEPLPVCCFARCCREKSWGHPVPASRPGRTVLALTPRPLQYSHAKAVSPFVSEEPHVLNSANSWHTAPLKGSRSGDSSPTAGDRKSRAVDGGDCMTDPMASEAHLHALRMVFSRLDAKSLCCSMHVCRSWRSLAQDPSLWKVGNHTRFPLLSFLLTAV